MNLEVRLFDEITTADILELVGRSENQFMDFKVQPIENYKLAKIISGFANARGGYIVFGAIEGEPDVCEGFAAIERPGVLKQTIQQLIRDHTDEPIQGVVSKDIQLPTGETILLVYVPESSKKPHGCRKQGERLLQFWIREGSHTVEMKMTEIRDAFLEESLRPYILFDLVSNEEDILVAVLSNKGQRLAVDIEVKTEPRIVKLERDVKKLLSGSIGVPCTLTNNRIASLAPGRELYDHIERLSRFLRDHKGTVYKVEVSYTDSRGLRYEEKYEINLDCYWDRLTIGKTERSHSVSRSGSANFIR